MRKNKEQAAEMSARQDLTTGPIASKLLLFSLPIIGGTIIQQLYNVVDSIVVGNFVGADALAAVSAGFVSMMVFNALFMGLSTGANIVISQYKGAGEQEKLDRAINGTVTLLLLLSVLITAAGLICCRPLLVLLKTPENILEDSCRYMSIIFIGTTGNIFYNGLTGLVRGLGDTKQPFWALVIASCLNVVLDLLFVIVFHWDIAGVAWATIISQFCSALYILRLLTDGRYGAKLSVRKICHIDWPIMKMVLKLGIPTALQDVFMSMGMMVIQRFANSFGSDYIAANAIIVKADGFAVMPMMGLSTAITTYVGQNTGAGNHERVDQGIRMICWITAGIAVVVGAILFFCGGIIGRVFTDEQAVIDMAAQGMRILAWFYIFMGLRNVFCGALRGAGAAAMAAIISLAGTVIRIPLAWIMAILPLNRAISASVDAGIYATTELAAAAGVGMEHYVGMFQSMSAAMLLSCLLAFLFFKFGHWKDKGITEASRSHHE